MRMKKFSRFFMSMLAMCTIAACSNDELGNEPVVDPGASTDAVYMNVTVQLPTGAGTRSNTNTPDGGDYGTSSDGTEVGKDRENVVNSVLLVLADKSNKLIGCATQEGYTSLNGGLINSIQSIEKTTLGEYYKSENLDANGNLKDNQINVYIFCNPNNQLRKKLKEAVGKTDWIDAKGTVIEKSTTDEDKTEITNEQDGKAVWGGDEFKDGFLMSTASNADIVKRIPLSLDDWKKHDKKETAFDLTGKNSYGNTDTDIDNTGKEGAIRVERAVARFDFKDGSTGNNTYDVVKEKQENESEKTIIKVQLQKMALINMSKNFYYLRRVSDDGLATNPIICGAETSRNYVVDTDYGFKNETSISENDLKEHFNFCLGNIDPETDIWSIDPTARNQWYSSNISDILENSDNEWNDNWKNKEYKIWRYATENTIPGSINNQRNGISTGIVFKGKMIAAESGSKLAKVMNADEPETELTGVSDEDAILYAHGEKIYIRWTEVRKAAISEKGTRPAFYEAVFGKNPGVTPVEEDGKEPVYSQDTSSPDYLWHEWQKDDESRKDVARRKAFKAAATSKENGFTLYQSSSDGGEKGYYCYYYYWNRHNDNGDNNVMGQMEFAVVRNNVYKLAVTEINALGHPRISENDPDNPTPEDKDEESDVFFKVSVKVLPWVVRVNNIEF